ncbi:polysaccharide deacetylase family protein [Pseudonocardia sp. GCM10023141]|uniref:polysaccharide deacetylase family protein n=1 Tax=Pseudonocardia sp. GCM10023141 TaxID=3252653 RepID=UPI00360640BB
MNDSIDGPSAADGQRWPGDAVAAVSVTMDNMGEAYELESNLWPSEMPVGNHFSVFSSLPPMLEILQSYNVQVTYFVEAWNTDVYPDTIKDVAARGHEIGLHGFRHEAWSALDPQREEELLDVSVRRFRELGISIRGFRPPGGGLNTGTRELLAGHGIDYTSPAGEHVVAADDHVFLPFRWRWIDAYCYFEPLEEMRKSDGRPPGLIDPQGFEEIMEACIGEVIESGGYASLLFHPFLHDDADRLAAMRRIVERISTDSRLWCAPCGEVADWVRGRPGMFDKDPGLTTQSWMR